jgi:hypothetical protein
MQKRRHRLHLQNSKLVTEGKIYSCIVIDKNDDIGNHHSCPLLVLTVTITSRMNVKHVERVKFSCRCFVGPCHSSKAPSSVNSVFENSSGSGRFTPNLNCSTQAHQPTCALNKEGVLIFSKAIQPAHPMCRGREGSGQALVHSCLMILPMIHITLLKTAADSSSSRGK